MPPFSDIVLTRRPHASIGAQLTAQIELKILGGELAHGQRLPSIRALARMLRISPNTVSSVYQWLVVSGRATRRNGAGIFVNAAGDFPQPGSLPIEARVHRALVDILAGQRSAADAREAVSRWLLTPPPKRVAVFDPVREMASLLASELRSALEVATEAVTSEDLAGAPPGRLAGSIVVALPYQVSTAAQFLPREAVEILTVHMPARVRQAIEELPCEAGAL